MATAEGTVPKRAYWGTEGRSKVASVACVAQSRCPCLKVFGDEEWGKMSCEMLQNQSCQWVGKRKKFPN